MRHSRWIFLMSLLSFFGITGASKAQSIAFSAEYGMRLLEQNKYDDSAAYFQKHLKGNAIAHYGLALTKFRRDTKNLTLVQTQEIIELYEQAIEISPAFADAYFMCGIAYYAAAGFQLGSFSKDNRPRNQDEFRQVDSHLTKSELYLRKAITLNPGFSSIADGELASNRRLKELSSKLKATQ
jgi:tetratricopeptide (TPR) repeat protein